MRNGMIAMQFIAKTFHGLEAVLAEELGELGATEIEPLTRAVAFEGDKELMYRANLELRTALRILAPIHSFPCVSDSDLYQGTKEIDWRPYLTPKDTFAVEAVVNSSHFNHSHFVALKTKDAIVDQLRDHYGQRPSIDLKSPDLQVNVHIREGICTILLDSSGEPLFKRSYRKETGPAPLNEVLAAGMLKLAGWPEGGSFLDPMCGSGTLPIEAALMATRTPVQWHRPGFAFQKWKDFDPILWEQVRQSAWEKRIPEAPPIFGSDSHPNAVRMSQANAEQAEVGHLIRWEKSWMDECPLPEQKGIVMLNPPYNERMGVSEIENLYQMIGATLKHRFSGSKAWVLSSNDSAIHAIGLRPSRKIGLFNGSLPCKFLKFDLYEGSKKGKKHVER